MEIPGQSSWSFDRINVIWSGHRSLDYHNEPFNDAATLGHWRQLGYTQTKFTGDMYDMRRPEPDWISDIRTHFSKWQHFSWSLYCMPPGTVLPAHKDTYARFIKLHAVRDVNKIHRAVIFLEPWASGHYFEIAGTPVTSWQAGDMVIWRHDTEHIAANVGTTNRYTLQITGVLSEDS